MSWVIKAGPTFEQLAQNDLGEPSSCSPAISGGRIFLKGDAHLFCIGSK
jgi:outer membrane protein assembly factor BamB